MHISLVLLPLLATLSYGKKSSDSGIEYVRACDSGSDDVTNMCINRIPDDIGQSSGNHACAYHEAEVKCLGLCGNTLTWKVAYQNALKRYRLVCASYIDERLAEKEEEGGDSGEDGTEEKPTKATKPRKEQEDGGEEDVGEEEDKKKNKNKKEEADKPAKKQQQQPQAKNTTGGSSQGHSTQADAKDAKDKKSAKPSATASASASKAASSTAAPRSTTTINLDDLLQQAGKKKATRSKPSGEERSLKGQAMLPSMDPELAGAAARAPCIWALAAAALGLAAMS
ncbi:hypothetical protein LPJ53_004124 [Coemansia erecta]|uniref:Uncharacterized protein n=1 Tax=Coemansia erecta TaxID=147472 RepID=A0A9W8CPI8_9FUNG|nr:hypothetical protein LPJ53_004124 [Coemansia erecta]